MDALHGLFHGERMGAMRLSLPVLKVVVCLAAGLISGCKERTAVLAASAVPAQRGAAAITTYGCGKCHTIPGIDEAKGAVGPPLEFIARRTYIAGNFPNTPDTLAHWIMAPQTMKPKTAMPSLGLTESQSRDVVAYLETLQ
jgi:cytochrome c2